MSLIAFQKGAKLTSYISTKNTKTLLCVANNIFLLLFHVLHIRRAKLEHLRTAHAQICN